MATRSTIAIEHEDGSIEWIYAHWDGYLDGNGEILNECYDTPELVKELIDHGDLSTLGETVDDTEFYHRDRGEAREDTQAGKFQDFDDYCRNHEYQEYDYIFRNDGKWYVTIDSSEYRLLEDALDMAEH